MATAKLPPDNDWDDANCESIAASFDEHARLTSLLRERIATLDDSDSDRWVGLGSDEVLVIRPTLDEVVAQLKAQGPPDRMLVVEFLESEPMEMILLDDARDAG